MTSSGPELAVDADDDSSAAMRVPPADEFDSEEPTLTDVIGNKAPHRAAVPQRSVGRHDLFSIEFELGGGVPRSEPAPDRKQSEHLYLRLEGRVYGPLGHDDLESLLHCGLLTGYEVVSSDLHSWTPLAYHPRMVATRGTDVDAAHDLLANYSFLPSPAARKTDLTSSLLEESSSGTPLCAILRRPARLNTPREEGYDESNFDFTAQRDNDRGVAQSDNVSLATPARTQMVSGDSSSAESLEATEPTDEQKAALESLGDEVVARPSSASRLAVRDSADQEAIEGRAPEHDAEDPLASTDASEAHAGVSDLAEEPSPGVGSSAHADSADDVADAGDEHLEEHEVASGAASTNTDSRLEAVLTITRDSDVVGRRGRRLFALIALLLLIAGVVFITERFLSGSW